MFLDDFGDEVERVDYPLIAKDYCRQVIAGTYPACQYVKLAAERYLEMLRMAETGEYGFVFSEAHACDFLDFTERLPLFEDNFRGVTRTELEPWQIWIGCALYGFRDVRNGHRWMLECYLEVPRKSAKSVLATAIALYDLRMEGATSPLVLIAASTLDQADRVFEPVRGIINSGADPDLRLQYKLKATDDYAECALNGGRIEKVASIGKRQDGWNPTTVILEELHAQNPDVYAVLKSAIGARGGQLLFQITTAGRDPSGLAWDNRKACIQILEGHEEEWKFFGVIFTVDESDIAGEDGVRNLERTLTDEQLWIKACPNLNVSFDIAAFRLLARSARMKPQEREEFYRTRLNIWTNVGSRLFNLELFRRGRDDQAKIEDFRKKKAWLGVDLSTADDFTALAAVIELENDDIMIFAKTYAAGDAPIFVDPDLSAMANDWRERRLIEAERAGRVRHAQVERDIRAWCQILDVVVIGADPAMAGELMDNLEDSRLPVVKFVNKPYMMSAPVDDLVARAHADGEVQLRYAADPLLEWCIGNAHGEKKRDGTIMMYKDSEKSLYKIDTAVAAAIANGLRLNPEFSDKVKKKPSVYETRGLIGWKS